MTDKTAETFRSSIRTVMDMAPPVPEIATQRHSRPLMRPVLAVASGFAVVTVVVGLSAIALRTSPPTLEPRATNEPVGTTMTPVTATTEADPAVTTAVPEIPDNVTLIRAGGPIAQLVGIRFGEIVVSEDDGTTWTTFHTTSGQIDALDVTSSGEIVAVASTPGSLRGTITGDSYSNATPRVLRYQHATGEWTTSELPRPPFDEANDRQGWWSCELMGVEDYVSATSVAAGPTVAIFGGHGMTDTGSCGGGAFLWTSVNGTDWTIDALPEGIGLGGIAWIDDTYLGYGTGDRWYDAQLWESPNLVDWSPAQLSGEVGNAFASTPISVTLCCAGGIHYAGPIPLGTSTALVFPVQELDVEIPDDLATIRDLRAALEGDPGLLSTIDWAIENLEITFPPTAEQLERLRNYYEASSNTIGRIVLARSITGVWTLVAIE